MLQGDVLNAETTFQLGANNPAHNPGKSSRRDSRLSCHLGVICELSRNVISDAADTHMRCTNARTPNNDAQLVRTTLNPGEVKFLQMRLNMITLV